MEVESRLSAREMMVGVRLLMEKMWLSSKLRGPKGRLGLGSALWGYQRRTGGYDWIWGGFEGPPTHSGFELSPSRPVGWHAVPCMPLALPRFGHLWIGLVSVLLVPQMYLAVQILILPLKCGHPWIVSVPVGPAVHLGSAFVIGCRWILPGCPGRPLLLVIPSGRTGSADPNRWSVFGVHLRSSVPVRG